MGLWAAVISLKLIVSLLTDAAIRAASAHSQEPTHLDKHNKPSIQCIIFCKGITSNTEAFSFFVLVVFVGFFLHVIQIPSLFTKNNTCFLNYWSYYYLPQWQALLSNEIMFKSQARFRDCWVLHISLRFSADTTNDDLRNQQWDFSDLGNNLTSVGAGLSNGEAQG